jgi:hypothetical protein
LGHLYFDIVSDLELRISDFATLGIFTLVKNPLQIAPFMQNKPNFRKAKMNVSAVNTNGYENNRLRRRRENKPNSKPIKANKIPKQTQYKPNQTQFQTGHLLVNRTKHNYLPVALFPLKSSTARHYNEIFSRLSISRERQMKGFGNE